MRFESFLLEGDMEREYTTPRSKRIGDPAEIENLIRSKCKTAWKAWKSKKAIIYRGTPKDWNYMLSDPRQSTIRLSANTRAYMNLLVDNLPSWRGFPKRGKSLICTTFHQTAKAYGRGNSFIVLPFENAKIGVCEDLDFWLSFSRLNLVGDDVSEFNNDLSNLFFVAKVSISGAEKSWDKLEKGIKTLEEELKKRDYKVEERMITDFWNMLLTDKPTDILTYMNKELDPIRNGFNLLRTGVRIESGHEVWIGEPSILVHIRNESWLGDLKI